MEKIIEMIQMLMEDHPELIITDLLIKEYIENNMDILVEEIYDKL